MKLFILAPKNLYVDELGYLSHIFKSPRIQVVGVAIHQPELKSSPKTLGTIIERIKKNARKLLSREMSLKEAWARFSRNKGIKLYARFAAKVHQTGRVSAETYFKEKGIPILTTAKKYSKEVVQFITSKEPEAMFRMGWGIIKEPLLSLTPKGIVSYHHGDIIKYRGIPPCFWPLYNGESEMKVTVQILEEGIDCGPVVKEKGIPIYKADTYEILNRRAYKQTYSMAAEACELLDNDQFAPKKLSTTEQYPLYTYPTLLEWLFLSLRVSFGRLTHIIIKDEKWENQ